MVVVAWVLCAAESRMCVNFGYSLGSDMAAGLSWYGIGDLIANTCLRFIAWNWTEF